MFLLRSPKTLKTLENEIVLNVIQQENTVTERPITNDIDSHVAAGPDTIAIYKAVKVDFKDMRKQRQRNNNKQVLDAIKSGDIERLKHVVNNNELDRVLNETGLSIDELVCYCKNLQ